MNTTHRNFIRNSPRDDRPISIKSASTSCGCTMTRDYTRTVASGAVWELAATFNTKRQRETVSKNSKKAAQRERSGFGVSG